MDTLLYLAMTVVGAIVNQAIALIFKFVKTKRNPANRSQCRGGSSKK